MAGFCAIRQSPAVLYLKELAFTSASDIIKQYAEENGIIAGVCDAGELPWGLHGTDTPFVRFSAEQRKTPGMLLENARSIIVIGAGYNRELAFCPDGAARGWFSLGAVGMDYHITLTRLLEGMEDALLRNGFVFSCFKSVDTGPLPEKHLAVKSGLGWIGKHGLVISDAFGSFFNIGYMITTIPIEGELEALLPRDIPNAARGLRCGACNVCVRSCPNGVLVETPQGDCFFDYRQCVSYLTQKKGELTPSERHALGKCLYGCDACQNACAYNQNTYVGKITSIDYIAPRLDDILSLSIQDFRLRYRSTAIFWRGLPTIKRNAAAALEKYQNGHYFHQ